MENVYSQNVLFPLELRFVNIGVKLLKQRKLKVPIMQVTMYYNVVMIGQSTLNQNCHVVVGIVMISFYRQNLMLN